MAHRLLPMVVVAWMVVPSLPVRGVETATADATLVEAPAVQTPTVDASQADAQWTSVESTDAPATTTDATSEAKEEPRDGTNFPKGAKTFHLDVNYIAERQGKDQSLASVAAGPAWYLHRKTSLGFDLVGYYTEDHGEDALGVGVNLTGRYHFLERGGFSFYGDLGGGTLWTTEDFPLGGTQVNFTYMAGFGVSVKIAENRFITGGAKFQHISNGFYEGRDQNPILNSYGGYVGLTIRVR